jgi:hypothetical protein
MLPILIPVSRYSVQQTNWTTFIMAEPVFIPAVTSTNQQRAHGYDAISCWLFYYGAGDRAPIPGLFQKIFFDNILSVSCY